MKKEPGIIKNALDIWLDHLQIFYWCMKLVSETKCVLVPENQKPETVKS